MIFFLIIIAGELFLLRWIFARLEVMVPGGLVDEVGDCLRQSRPSSPTFDNLKRSPSLDRLLRLSESVFGFVDQSGPLDDNGEAGRFLRSVSDSAAEPKQQPRKRNSGSVRFKSQQKTRAENMEAVAAAVHEDPVSLSDPKLLWANPGDKRRPNQKLSRQVPIGSGKGAQAREIRSSSA